LCAFEAVDLLQPVGDRLSFADGMSKSSVGLSCGTLVDGYGAVTEEDEAALLAQEEAILKEIKDH
jgi:hypothetical protein